MQIDNTLAEIIVEVQKRLKAKYNVDLTFDQVSEIVDVQLTATVFGFSRNVAIYWKGFLKFVWTNRRERLRTNRDLFDTVRSEDSNLSDNEREYFLYLAKISAANSHQVLERAGIHAKGITAKELITRPSNTVHVRNFKLLIPKKKK